MRLRSTLSLLFSLSLAGTPIAIGLLLLTGDRASAGVVLVAVGVAVFLASEYAARRISRPRLRLRERFGRGGDESEPTDAE